MQLLRENIVTVSPSMIVRPLCTQPVSNLDPDVTHFRHAYDLLVILHKFTSLRANRLKGHVLTNTFFFRKEVLVLSV